ncbi:hypothetical protein [Limnoraphis robusta]|uniref:hypothetical protein n=1 Tax=Limnoraphis robusta TaxID=1118279 RepID=UPI002B203989|nr:hypothetical protein [Limnoraphis robusta]MEA5500834.1 hypothetical protein [Limnoraphis robusta BA-68 BA1]
MFSIDIIVKYTPIPLSVEQKSLEDAQATYQRVIDAMQASQPQVIELTCDKIPDKKISIVSSEISAVQISQKTASTTGRAPGFAMLGQ